MIMRMAFVIFDNMTTLDFVGFHNAVTWLKKRHFMEDLSWDFCSSKEEVLDDRGMMIKVDHVLPNLSSYDVVFVPGGIATRSLIHDRSFIDWIRTAKEVTYKVSVCTGALLYGAAGFLEGKKATTNPLAYDLLEPYCEEVIKLRVFRDGNIFTGGGITASIDLGLFFVESITSRAVARDIQVYMDYPYYDQVSLD